MPSHFEFLRFKLFTPEYRAIHDNALRSAELFVQCAKGEAVEAAFQKNSP